jgi:hypothetical protein
VEGRAAPSSAHAIAAGINPSAEPCPAALQIWKCSQDESNHKVHEFFTSDHFAEGIEVIPGARRLAMAAALRAVVAAAPTAAPTAATVYMLRGGAPMVLDPWLYIFCMKWTLARSNFTAPWGYPLRAGSYESLQRLRHICDLMVVTSRQHVIQQPTLEWIERHYPEVR